MPDARLSARLYDQARAERWQVARATFDRALDASAEKAFAGRVPSAAELARYLSGLRLEDLALACGCATGDEAAWQHFVLTYRPALYRAADSIDPTGSARELADSLYADLFGLKSSGGERQSLFRYFHGRSTLSTWLRAVLAQRHVDRMRDRRKSDPLPDDDSGRAPSDQRPAPDPERRRFLELMQTALAVAVALLAPKDRLRLACYYAQQMTLAQVGRMLGEHEATVSRQLARARGAIRESVEHHLAHEQHLTAEQIEECFTTITADAGPLDVRELFGAGVARPLDAASRGGSPATGKKSALDRSNRGET